MPILFMFNFLDVPKTDARICGVYNTCFGFGLHVLPSCLVLLSPCTCNSEVLSSWPSDVKLNIYMYNYVYIYIYM